MAAVLVTIATFFCTDAPAKSIHSMLLKARQWIRPNGARCKQILWDDDILDGEVHQCVRFKFCNHWAAHSQEMSCWEMTLGQVFNRAWRSTSRQVRFTKKPDELAFNEHFLCTDVDTILAFILCTIGTNDTCKPGCCNASSFHFADTVVTLRAHSDVLVAHLRGNIDSKCVNLTKHKIQMMLQGYRPDAYGCLS